MKNIFKKFYKGSGSGPTGISRIWIRTSKSDPDKSRPDPDKRCPDPEHCRIAPHSSGSPLQRTFRKVPVRHYSESFQNFCIYLLQFSQGTTRRILSGRPHTTQWHQIGPRLSYWAALRVRTSLDRIGIRFFQSFGSNSLFFLPL